MRYNIDMRISRKGIQDFFQTQVLSAVVVLLFILCLLIVLYIVIIVTRLLLG